MWQSNSSIPYSKETQFGTLKTERAWRGNLSEECPQHPKHSNLLFQGKYWHFYLIWSCRNQEASTGGQDCNLPLLEGRQLYSQGQIGELKKPGEKHSCARAGVSTLSCSFNFLSMLSPPWYNGNNGVLMNATGCIQLKTRKMTKPNGLSCSLFYQVTSSFHIIK